MRCCKAAHVTAREVQTVTNCLPFPLFSEDEEWLVFESLLVTGSVLSFLLLLLAMLPSQLATKSSEERASVPLDLRDPTAL